jgi:hypothetical protein
MLSETPKGRSSLNGHVAHIVAAEDDGPRADPTLDVSARNAEPNLLLLCFKHHEQVDDHPDEFPVDVLVAMKRAHEEWVAERIQSPNAAAQLATDLYSGIITSMLENLNVPDWTNWSVRLTTDTPRINWYAVDQLQAFVQDVFTAAWPHINVEFEAAARTLADEIDSMLLLFQDHGHPLGDETLGITMREQLQNLKRKEWNSVVAQHKKVVQAVANHVVRATKAANWIADVVRRDFDPTFLPRRLQIEDDRPLEFESLERAALTAKYSPS